MQYAIMAKIFAYDSTFDTMHGEIEIPIHSLQSGPTMSSYSIITHKANCK